MHHNYFSTSDPFLPKPSQPCSGNYTQKKKNKNKNRKNITGHNHISYPNQTVRFQHQLPNQNKRNRDQPNHKFKQTQFKKNKKKTHTTHNGDHDSDALPVQPNNPQNRDLISLNTPDPLPN